MPIPISRSIINTVLLTVRVLSIIYIKDKGNMQARQKTYNKSGEEWKNISRLKHSHLFTGFLGRYGLQFSESAAIDRYISFIE